MSMKWISILLLLELGCYFSCGTCGKVLVWPADYSHWINMETILEELIKRGHEVIVLTSSNSILVGSNKSSAIKFEIFQSSLSKKKYDTMINNLITTWLYDMPKNSFLAYYSKMQDYLWEMFDAAEQDCKNIVFNKKLMQKLQDSRFDLVFADAIIPCGELLAEILKVPLVYILSVSPGSVIERHGGGLPLPPSYVPVMWSELNNPTKFTERVKNMLYWLYFNFWYQLFNEKKWDQFYTEVLGRPCKVHQLMAKAQIWLMRTYWDFQFPHPILPNFEFVGGLQCKPAKSLPKEMEEFVQSSGENGIVVFSLGSMISNMPEEKANMVASALAQIPQKVLWRYEGKKPDTLGTNTRLYKWIPQNDLLGHPKTKAFVTHGGSNGIYEAIYHGIPMVGIPLCSDQPYNIALMKAKGAAIGVDFEKMSSSDLLNALKTVINDPSYKKNALKLKAIQHDQPMKPLDRAVFWMEFVMRHKGAKHLRPASHELNLFQYLSLDVIGFLLACVGAALWFITKSCLGCCQMFYKRGKREKRKKE